jgi:thiol-disulfide isomerase/thioredoxin
MENKIVTLIFVAIVGGSILGFSFAYLIYTPQINDAREEIDILTDKLELAASDEPISSSMGQGPASNFSLIDIDGNNITLSDMRGKVVLLDFMATWCGPCQAAMPSLVKLFENMGDQIELISISIDPSSDTREVLSSWRDQWGAEWVHVRDLASPPLVWQYWIRMIPTYVIIDQNGNIQYRHIGFVSLDILEMELSSLLEK